VVYDAAKRRNGTGGVDPPNGVLDVDRRSDDIDSDASECGLDRSAAPDAVVDGEALSGAAEGPPGTAFTARHIAKFCVAKAYDRAARVPLMGRSAWLARNLYRKGKGRPWLSMEEAGISRRASRLASREALKPDEIMSEACRGHCPAEPELCRPNGPLSAERERASYEAISKLNIVDNVARVTAAFYEGLKLSPLQSPVYRCLAGIRSKLAEEVEAHGAVSTGSALERFEFAWRAHQAGDVSEALKLFREVVADDELAEAGAADPRAREAYIRAAEILAHHAELRGDAYGAASLYRRILRFEGNGIVARRLLLTLWRGARLREAAELAPRIVQSDGRLLQHLRGSDSLNDLTRRLRLEARRDAAAEKVRGAPTLSSSDGRS
jgi:hypothetical protein